MACRTMVGVSSSSLLANEGQGPLVDEEVNLVFGRIWLGHHCQSLSKLVSWFHGNRTESIDRLLVSGCRGGCRSGNSHHQQGYYRGRGKRYL